MITQAQLKDILHNSSYSSRDRLLIVLGSEGAGAKSVAEVKRIAIAAGLRAASKWDISSLLRVNKGSALAVRTNKGWELTSDGNKYLFSKILKLNSVDLGRDIKSSSVDGHLHVRLKQAAFEDRGGLNGPPTILSTVQRKGGKSSASAYNLVTKLRKAAVFIGSSTEGLSISRLLQVEMDHEADTTIWSQGVYGLSGGTLESLVKAAPNFDFAVLVLTPDDVVTKRDRTGNAPRDNVIFELGLFIGVLGKERTYIVHPRVSIDLPSDLAGITPATYEPSRRDGNLHAAIGSAATKILSEIRKLGPR